MEKLLSLTNEEFERGAECLRALASPVRIKILLAIKDEPLCVTEICKKIGMTQASLSQHLNMLRHKGLVTRTRKGNKVYYSIASDSVKKFLELLPKIACFEQLS